MEPPKRKRLKPGELVKLTLTLAQVDLITEHTLIGENLLAYNALIKNEKISIANNVKKVHLVYQINRFQKNWLNVVV